MTPELEYRERKAAEVEAALEEVFGELERLDRQYYRLADGRRLMFYNANGSTWYAIPQRYLQERLEEDDLVAVAWTDEDLGQQWVFAIPVGRVNARIAELGRTPSPSGKRYHLTLERRPEGFRLRELDFDLDEYRVLSRETRMTRPLMGLKEPPEALLASTTLSSEKLQRLLRWRLEGTEDQGNNFDFVKIRRRLRALQPIFQVLESDPEEFTEAAWQTVLENLHAAQRQKTNILKNNEIEDVRHALRALLFDDQVDLSERMERFKGLNNVGVSISGELIGWFDPDRYPLRNSCAEDGLRFFGFEPGRDYESFRASFEAFAAEYKQLIGQLQPDIPTNLEIDQLFNQIHKVDLKETAKEEEAGASDVTRHWRITLPAQGALADVWEHCLEHGIAAINFAESDDHWQVRKFAEIKPGDWVVAFLRDRQIGAIGMVTEGYRPVAANTLSPEEDYWDGSFLRRIRVEWYERGVDVNQLSKETRDKFGQVTVQALSPAEFHEVRELYADLIDSAPGEDEEAGAVSYSVEDFILRAHQADSGWHDEVVDLLKQRGQVILYGPPGTGKTFLARELAKSITGLTRPGESRFQLIQFHPAYSYEEFIEGIRPESVERDGQQMVSYPIRDGAFRRFCRNAANESGPCVFVIDEINRGNIASVFGELMYALEYRDAEAPVRLPYSGKSFRIPPNVYIIGTMNTADRSISLMDFALRRRFHFIRCPADPAILARWIDNRQPPVPYLLALFELLHEAIEDEDYRIGVSYFMDDALTEERLERVWRRSIEPYLETYFMDRRDQVEEFRWRSGRLRRLRDRHDDRSDA